MKVYIHYNARDFLAPNPQDDRWHNYSNPDSAKMFCVCADSWNQGGFQPVRLDSSQVDGFKFKGKLIPHANTFGKCYPLEFWNVWFLLKKLAPCLWVTTDVINWRMTTFDMMRHIEIAQRIWRSKQIPICWNAQNVWTNSCSYVTPEFCQYVIDTCIGVDAGRLPLPQCELVSDESILRETINRFEHEVFPSVGISAVNLFPGAPLIHYPRSSLTRGIDERWAVVR